ncbi:MAG TPA: DUF2161 family putative PD-(D/E)XK-type phosphodiesterase [Stellaceae bacterium]|nr:DUF2161 family putative PD-(D/E)XK-type phosphodiesterase [Stellaceae bacterium]
MNDSPTTEAALYRPVKAYLEAQGFEVKGEVCGCDLVARRGDEPPVIVELKLRFSLALVFQGIDRLRITDRVYLAVPRPPHRARGLSPEAPPVRRLCRRLGLGLIIVGRRGDSVAILEEPGPYRPRPARRRILRLATEFARREGDLNIGGRTRAPIVTAYRQDALRCARALADCGPLRLRVLRALTGVDAAAPILQRNVYGWFARIARGTYALTEPGHAALVQFADAVAALAALSPEEKAA